MKTVQKVKEVMKYKSGGRGCALRIVGVTVLVILLLISNAAALLTQECGDRNYIINTSSHIVEGTVEKVESKWNEGNTSIYTYTNISIEKYVKGVPIPGNKVQIITYGGVIGEVKQWGEDQPDFREGKKVRVYLQEKNGDFSLVCAEFGVKEIFTDDITGVSPDERWNKTFGGTFGLASSVQQTADGGYILAGSTKSDISGEMDAWLIKTDATGNEMWNKSFGGTSNDFAYSVQQTKDGGYIVAGETGSYGGIIGAWLIKTDAEGNEQWNKTFWRGKVDSAESVQQTSDGGYIVAGTLLLKTDANGSQQWSKTLDERTLGSNVKQTSDGGYVLVGIKFSNKSKPEPDGTYGIQEDAWLIKIDASGNEQWNSTFGGIRSDGARSVEQTNDGGYILAGYTYSYGAGQNDVWLIKTDAKGNEMWNKTFGGMFYDYARSVRQTPDDGYILAGSTRSYGAIFDAWLIKTNASGNMQWSKIIGGAKSDSAESIQPTQDGGYILAGSTASYGAGSVNAWLIKVGGEAVEPTKIPTASPTRTPTVIPTEKVPGFEAFLAITILLAVYTAGRKRR